MSLKFLQRLFGNIKSKSSDNDHLNNAEVEKIDYLEYLSYTPSWWNAIVVNFPEYINTVEEAKEFIIYNFGAEVGTKVTWKYALKSWWIFFQRNKSLPVYIGHCLVKGGDYNNAAKIFSELYFFSNKQKGNEEWYKCYLSYSAGNAYAKINDFDKAIYWFSNSAQEKYLKSKDEAIKYYAIKSKSYVSECTKAKLNPGYQPRDYI